MIGCVSAVGIVFYQMKVKPRPQADKAVGLMEAGDFDEAAGIMGEYVSWFRGNGKDHYVYAVALIRKRQPDIKQAVRHRRKAERMGYRVPEWFDNYALLQQARGKKCR